MAGQGNKLALGQNNWILLTMRSINYPFPLKKLPLQWLAMIAQHCYMGKGIFFWLSDIFHAYMHSYIFLISITDISQSENRLGNAQIILLFYTIEPLFSILLFLKIWAWVCLGIIQPLRNAIYDPPSPFVTLFHFHSIVWKNRRNARHRPPSLFKLLRNS